MCAMPPHGCSQPLCVLTVEGDDVRPHIAGVVIQFVRDSGEVNCIVITEEAVLPPAAPLWAAERCTWRSLPCPVPDPNSSSVSVMSADAVAFVGCER